MGSGNSHSYKMEMEPWNETKFYSLLWNLNWKDSMLGYGYCREVRTKSWSFKSKARILESEYRNYDRLINGILPTFPEKFWILLHEFIAASVINYRQTYYFRKRINQNFEINIEATAFIPGMISSERKKQRSMTATDQYFPIRPVPSSTDEYFKYTKLESQGIRFT